MWYISNNNTKENEEKIRKTVHRGRAYTIDKILTSKIKTS